MKYIYLQHQQAVRAASLDINDQREDEGDEFFAPNHTTPNREETPMQYPETWIKSSALSMIELSLVTAKAKIQKVRTDLELIGERPNDDPIVKELVQRTNIILDSFGDMVEELEEISTSLKEGGDDEDPKP